MDKKLHQRLCDKDETAYQELFNEYNRKVLAYVMLKVNNLASAEDIMQSTFVKVAQNIESLNKVESFDAWLYKIADNLCIDEYRLAKNRNEVNVSGYDIDTLYESDNKDEWYLAEVFKSLAQLDTRNREIVLYKFMFQMSDKEISEVLDIPVGTVKSRLHSSKQLLKKILSSYGVSAATLSGISSPMMISWYLKEVGAAQQDLTPLFINQLSKSESLQQGSMYNKVTIGVIASALFVGGTAIWYFNRDLPSDDLDQKIPQQVEVVSKNDNNEGKIDIDNSVVSVPVERDKQINEMCYIKNVSFSHPDANGDINVYPEIECNTEYNYLLNEEETNISNSLGSNQLDLVSNGKVVDAVKFEINYHENGGPVVISSQKLDSKYVLSLDQSVKESYAISVFMNNAYYSDAAYDAGNQQIIIPITNGNEYQVIIRDQKNRISEIKVRT